MREGRELRGWSWCEYVYVLVCVCAWGRHLSNVRVIINVFIIELPLSWLLLLSC